VKTLEDQMSFYAAYHQDARNKATHFVGVPVIAFSLLIPLGWLRVDLGGFALQLWGHVYEGRKPALVDNLFQVFVAPIFLAAGVFFALGYKPRLHEEVQRRALEMRARAGATIPRGDLKSA
jgi:uncharacterized membrane protein YGL010W